MPVSVPAVVAKDKVPFKAKMAVGAGGLARFYGNVGVNSLATPFYQMMMGVNPALLGLALAIPRLWDAVTDPVMGHISDNFQSRFGRRRPFILVGAWTMAIAFGLIWMVPEAWGETAKLAWFIVTSLIFYTVFTLFSVPYTSLTCEMTPDYDERTNVMGYVTFFTKAGEFTYQWVVPAAGLAIFASMVQGVQIVAWLIAIFGMALLGSLPALFVKERYYKVRRAEDPAAAPFWRSFREVMRNRAFLILLGTVLLQVLTGMLAASLDYYLLVYYMFDGDIAKGSLWKGIMSSGYAVVGFVGIPLLAWACARFGKRRILIWVYILACVGGVARWFIFTPGNHVWVLLDPVFNSYYWLAVGMIKPSMIADICDEDELAHGQRREGMFNSAYSWVTKTAGSLAFLGAGLVLVWVGFESKQGGAQSEGTFLYMRLFMAGGNIIPSLLSILLVMYYPITRETALATRAKLEAGRGQV